MRKVMASELVSVDSVVGSPEDLASTHFNALEKPSDLPPELALRKAVPYLTSIVEDSTFLGTEILPLLQEAGRAKDWYVAHRYDAPDDSYSLQVFVWPPGTGTRIHDHSSWGVYCCVVGSVTEERYKCLDDGSVPGHARLRKVWKLRWAPEDGVSTVLPGDGGIHRVSNPGENTAISVHLYGPRTGKVDGRDYDPSRDYVCDRRD
jgi:predicted metal-dependent enzyme (double-stranded beta helix superfamily)